MVMVQAVGDLSSSAEEAPQGPRDVSPLQDSVNGTAVTYTPIQVASALSLVVGVWQVGVLDEGFRGRRGGSGRITKSLWNYKWNTCYFFFRS